MIHLHRDLALIGVGFNTAYGDKRNLVVAAIGHAVAVGLFYFLWKGIYGEALDRIAGMPLNAVLVQVLTAQTFYVLCQTNVSWMFAWQIRSGQIAVDMTRPLSLRCYYFWWSIGRFLANAIAIIPGWICFLLFIGEGPKYTGLGNLFAVIASFGFAYALAFLFDFIVGMAGFVTATQWAVVASKDAVVLFFGGALVPVQFFPDWLKAISDLLPFQHMYQTPVALAFGIQSKPVLMLVAQQIFWCAVIAIIGYLLLSVAQRNLAVRGG